MAHDYDLSTASKLKTNIFSDDDSVTATNALASSSLQNRLTKEFDTTLTGIRRQIEQESHSENNSVTTEKSIHTMENPNYAKKKKVKNLNVVESAAPSAYKQRFWPVVLLLSIFIVGIVALAVVIVYGGDSHEKSKKNGSWNNCCNDKDWSCCKGQKEKNKRMAISTTAQESQTAREILPIFLNFSSENERIHDNEVIIDSLRDCFEVEVQSVNTLLENKLSTNSQTIYTIDSICSLKQIAGSLSKVSKNKEIIYFIVLRNPLFKFYKQIQSQEEKTSFEQIIHSNTFAKSMLCNKKGEMNDKDLQNVKQILIDYNIKVTLFSEPRDFIENLKNLLQKSSLFEGKSYTKNLCECLDKYTEISNNNDVFYQHASIRHVSKLLNATTVTKIKGFFEANYYDFSIYLDYYYGSRAFH